MLYIFFTNRVKFVVHTPTIIYLGTEGVHSMRTPPTRFHTERTGGVVRLVVRSATDKIY
jgi:hypothetical protein